MNSHCFKLNWYSSISFNLSNNYIGPYLSLEKENFCVMFTYSIKQVHDIKKFHVAVLQQQLRNVQKSMMHVQSCCIVNIKLLLFNCSGCSHHRRCLNSLLLRSRNFATMVMWRHTFSLYSSILIWKIEGNWEALGMRLDCLGRAGENGPEFHTFCKDKMPQTTA